jgi:hypothetical protein
VEQIDPRITGGRRLLDGLVADRPWCTAASTSSDFEGQRR